ncbi:ComEA family DNA-binding protein [Petrachloros mirabilis]
MLYSLLLKLAMLAMTMGIVFWIGWTVPQNRYEEISHQSAGLAIETDNGLSAALPGNADTLIRKQLEQPYVQQNHSQTAAEKKLDLNKATEHDLESLPGIGPTLADRIMQYRRVRGSFQKIEQLRDIKGIGEKKFERIRALVTVGPPPASSQGGRKTT